MHGEAHTYIILLLIEVLITLKLFFLLSCLLLKCLVYCLSKVIKRILRLESLR